MRTFLPKIVAIFIVFLSFTTLVPAHAQTAVQGQVVLDIGSTWDGTRVFRPSVIYNGSMFMMWYSGGSGGVHNIGLATSSDGKTWTRYAQDPNFAPNPVLTPGSPGNWDSDSVDESWIIQDGGQYKMWYSGQHWNPEGSIQNWEIGYATSPDGIHWTKYTGNPVLMPGTSGSFDDKYVWRPIVVATGSGFLMYYRGAPQTSGTAAKAGFAASSDGIHWTKTGVLSMPQGSSDWDAFSRSTGTLNLGGVIKADATYIMSYSSIKTQDSPQEIGVATSNDGTNWTPYLGNPVITYGSSGFDKAGVTRPTIVIVGDKYYVYYDAFENGSPDFVPDRIALAILPLSMQTQTQATATQSGIDMTTIGPVVIIAIIIAMIAIAAFAHRRRKPMK